MSWTDRQQGMLQAMGLRLWQPVPVPQSVPQPMAQPTPKPPAAQGSLAPVATQPPRPVPVAPRTTAGAGLDASAKASESPAQAPVTRPLPADWSALQEAVAACRACALCDVRQQALFGSGHPQAHWMIVGESPVDAEDRQGEPFVDAPGRLLDNMLRALQLTRSEAPAAQQVFITHALKCLPPSNRPASAAELALCRPFLERQVATVRPRVILALGRQAAQALLGGEAPLGRLRGQVHQAWGVPVVVSFAPAYLLRQPSEKAKAWDDLRLAASVAEGLAP
jgi:uracil-DNA glycosylase family 4